MSEKRLVCVEDLASFLSVSSKSVYRYVQQAAIPFLRIGKHLRFDKEAVLSHLQNPASIETSSQAKPTLSLSEAREAKRSSRRGPLSENRERVSAPKDGESRRNGVGNGN